MYKAEVKVKEKGALCQRFQLNFGNPVHYVDYMLNFKVGNSNLASIQAKVGDKHCSVEVAPCF